MSDLPARLGRDLPSWPGLWRHRARGRLAALAGGAGTPLLAVGGHHDHFAADTLDLWRRWGGPSARLVMGPWGHGLVAQPGPDATPQQRVNLGELYVSWARLALAGRLADGHRGALALGGSTLWVPAGTEGEPYEPVLSLLRGARFTADPELPVPSDDLAVPADGPPDRCLLVTPPLPRPLDVLGPAEVRLRATADTTSADWFARLVTVHPDGRAERLAIGVVRHDQPQPQHTAVPLGRLARRLTAGSRLRLEIAGHHFPAHARNPHTGDDPVTARRLLRSRREVDAGRIALRLTVLRSRPTTTDPVQEILR